uniref:Uncharacterized protein n=1 Tax=Zea mays TaxID=4577 RepID=C0P398_MAIZE|nr:unknown [Zea mays]
MLVEVRRLGFYPAGNQRFCTDMSSAMNYPANWGFRFRHHLAP